MLRVLLAIDMQNGVFVNPRFDRSGRVERINQLSQAADRVIFIRHQENDMPENSPEWTLLPEVNQP